MGQSGKNIKEVSAEEFNKLLDDFDMLNISYDIDVGIWTVKAKTASNIYKCKLGDDSLDDINPNNISKIFHKTTKYHYIEDDPQLAKLYGYRTKYKKDKIKVYWDIDTAIGLTYTNNRYSRKFVICYSYDINSAFSWAMLQKMPDTRQLPRVNGIVGEDEMGFYKNGKVTITPGMPADYVFPLIESPFKDYVYKYYELKQKEKDSNKRKMWKFWLNIPTGVLQRHNIFLRNAVLFYSNKKIESYIDENTIYCNTDSIVSLKRRYDIPLGDEIGLFKEEHKNEKFKFIKEGIYQWNNECHYKGIKGSCITDIEHTDNWFEKCKSQLPYKYNNITRRIEKNV